MKQHQVDYIPFDFIYKLNKTNLNCIFGIFKDQRDTIIVTCNHQMFVDHFGDEVIYFNFSNEENKRCNSEGNNIETNKLSEEFISYVKRAMKARDQCPVRFNV
jgi:hypothetical protein